VRTEERTFARQLLLLMAVLLSLVLLSPAFSTGAEERFLGSLRLVPLGQNLPCTKTTLVALPDVPDGNSGEMGSGARDAVRIDASLDESFTPDLDPTLRWTLSFSFDRPGCWTPRTSLVPSLATPPKTKLVKVPVWPAGFFEGNLVVPPHERPPTTVTVRLTPTPSEDVTPRPPQSSVDCPVRAERFSCVLPADVLDLRLELGDFIPEYAWGVRIRAGETVEMEPLSLARGASLFGWVEVSPPVSLEDTQLELVPETSHGDATAVGERLASRKLEARATERGFFQFRAIPPGSYRLTARHSGFSVTERAPIALEGLQELVLDAPLVLEPLAKLALSIDPPLAPNLQPWHVRLQRAIPLASMFRIVAEGAVSPDGFWTGTDLDAGRYLVQLHDTEGSVHYQQEFDVRPGTRPLHVELDHVPVRGLLRAGERPLARGLWFHRLDGRRVRMNSDAEGHFEGVLPEAGTWEIRLEPLNGRGQHFLSQEVDVARARGQSWVDLDITLPATELLGDVVDEDREPVDGALVTVIDGDRLLAQTFTAGRGGFELVGLPPGEYLVRAEARKDRESRPLSFELEADEPATLELTLFPRRNLVGRVFLEAKPVAGALIRYTAALAPIHGETHTDPEGRYRVTLPQGVNTLEVVVLSPGLPIRMETVELPPSGRSLPSIQFRPSAGDLAVRLPHRQPAYIRRDGGFVPLWSLLLPVDQGTLRGLDPKTGILHLPLEAGSYTLCPSPQESEVCVAGYLAAQGELYLDLRGVQARERRPR